MASQATGAAVQSAASDSRSRSGKYLTFKLAGEEYGLEILRVTTIIGVMEITAVPQTPSYVRGVINLRGKVIPVVDMRAKFGMPTTEDTSETCIIVVEVRKGAEAVQMGVLVDSVSEVLNIAGDDIEDAPSFGGAQVDTEFILGIAKAGASVKILLDIDKVLVGTDAVVEADPE
jgi:purine-binding chemotaxis protein CheW